MSDYAALPEDLAAPKPATQTTIDVNRGFRDKLDFSDRQSFETV